ncbi:hypothetical protein Q6A51_19905, partial [Pseudomonas sp. KFB-139]
LDASLIGTLLLSLSTIAGTEISNPSWVNFQSAGWVSFQSAPTVDRSPSQRELGQKSAMVEVLAAQKQSRNDGAAQKHHAPH